MFELTYEQESDLDEDRHGRGPSDNCDPWMGDVEDADIPCPTLANEDVTAEPDAGEWLPAGARFLAEFKRRIER